MRRRLWLCVPPALFALIDYAVTMHGQPAGYWAGNYAAANEGNPLVRWCMAAHPLLFHGLTLLWLAAIGAIILKAPRLLARFVMLAITFSHTHCVATWIWLSESEPAGFYRMIALCIGCAIVCVMALELCDE